MRVALIDDDAAILDSLSLYLERQGFAVTCFSSAEGFLGEERERAPFDCVVTDVRMPGLSGMDFARQFFDRDRVTPLILITGHGDVEMAVKAIKLGAFEFLEKPFDEGRLADSIRRAVGEASEKKHDAARREELIARRDGLSERQRQVFDLAVMGLSNKEIAARLAISVRTVEIHRAWVMERMGARNVAELVRMDAMIGKPSPN